MKSRISLAVADPARGCVSNDCKLDVVDITEALLHRNILITSSGLIMSHTLIIMHWHIELSSSQDKRGVSCQCGDWCPPVANKGPGYQYGRIYPDKSMKWIRYLYITAGLRALVPKNDRASHKRPSDGLVTSAARRFVPSWWIQIDMSIINK